MAIKLTDALLRNLKSGPKPYDLHEGAGFEVRVHPSGTRTFYYRYDFEGRRRHLLLGEYVEGEGSLAAARAAYKVAVALRAQGIDPMARRLEEEAERRAKAEEAARARKDAQENSFAAVAEQFIKLHVSQKLKPKPASYAARMIRNEMVKAWGTRPIVEIGKREVLDLVQGIAARAPIQANRVMQTARKLFGWAQKRGIIASNPVAGLDKPAKERSRDRVLTDQEVKAIWRAAETLGYPYGTVTRLLLLTGQRLGEVAKMRRADVDGDYWTISDPKNDHPHGIVLPPLAREVLAETPSLAGEYLLSATGGQTLLNGWSKPKARLDKQIAEDDTPVAHWTFHDLRRTAASGMARLGVAPHVIEAVLNHRSGQVKGIARVYNRYGYREEVARALAVWADHVERLIGEKPASNVLPMRAAG